MKRFIIACAVVLSSIQSISPADAVLNGLDGINSKYVVPLRGSASSCSGALLNPRLVVTAGHCTRNSDDQPDKELYVGLPGSDKITNKEWVKVSEIIVEPNFNFAYRGTVPLNDIAFLILSSDINQIAINKVAEATDITSLNGLGPVLELHGYGYKGEGDPKTNNVSTNTPLIGNFYIDSFGVFDPTLQGMSSKTFSACNGDSGAPVVYVKGSDVTLVGINVGGGGLTSNCRKMGFGGYYSTEIQLVHKHQPLYIKALTNSVKALNSSLNSLVAKNKDADDASKATIESLRAQITAGNQALQEKSAEMARLIEEKEATIQEEQAKNLELEAEIAKLKEPKPTTIVCTKGSAFKVVKKINPVCPKGFKAN